MSSLSLRRMIVAVFCAVLLAAPAGSAGLAAPVGGIVAPDGGCDDSFCAR